VSSFAEATGVGTLVLLLAGSLIVIASISITLALRFIWSDRDGRAQRARQMLRVSIRRVAITFAAVMMLGIAWRYWQDARLRATCGPRDRMTEYSPDGRYVAKYCSFGDTIVLKLYGRDDARPLAERTYRDTSGVLVSLTWTKDGLIYPEGDILRTINLPPSLYDRILTQLP